MTEARESLSFEFKKKNQINNRYNGSAWKFFKSYFQFNLNKIANENIKNLAIKIDVDGNESEVILHLERTIKMYKPLLLIEINKRIAKKREELIKIYNILNDSNYKIINKNRLTNLESLKNTSKLYGRDLIFKSI